MNYKCITSLKKILNWLKELPYSKCPRCGHKSVYFSHEEHFNAGSLNVYHCKFCNEYFI